MIFCALVMASTQVESPEIGIVAVIRPHDAGGSVDFLDVEPTIHGLDVAEGRPLLRLPLSAAGTPSIRLDGDALHASDEQGAIPLSIEDEAPGRIMVQRRWIAGRAGAGDGRDARIQCVAS